MERDILADELARSQSHMGLAQEQLEKAHAEIEHMRSSMEEMRHQLITGQFACLLLCFDVLLAICLVHLLIFLAVFLLLS